MTSFFTNRIIKFSEITKKDPTFLKQNKSISFSLLSFLVLPLGKFRFALNKKLFFFHNYSEMPFRMQKV